jgi:AcrR family transcriptional regulator
MARRPRERSHKQRAAESNGPGADNAGMNGEAPGSRRLARMTTERGKIVEAFMDLLAEQSIEEIDFTDIAERAGVSLADLRGEFGSRLAMLAAHVKDIDREVLAAESTDMAEEGPRERLFDVLMRRLDAQEPYKEAIRSLLHSARRNPGLACALNSLAMRSQRWMLAAADIPCSGPVGAARAQGLALLYGRVLTTFIDDDEPGHPRTMAALDRALARGQWWIGLFDRLCRLVPSCRPRRQRHAELHEDDGEPVAI